MVDPNHSPEPTADRSAAASRRPSPTVRTLVRLGVLVAIGASLFIFWGAKAHLKPWSQAIVNGVVKYTYPPTGQAETTVVLFLEENLRDLKESYPVSYERHAEVLEALAIHQPGAVFIDFVFLDERDEVRGAEPLRRAICELKEAGTNVYVAVLTRVKPTDPMGWALDCAFQVSAQMEADEGASGVLRYANGVGSGIDFLPTPAFQMMSERLNLDPRNAQKMELIWGNGVPDLNKKWMRGCAREGSWVSHLRSFVWDDNPIKSVKLRCPYTRTMSVSHLLGSSGDTDVGEALAGRAVFYGAAFHLTGDRVASPVFEDMPGVYLHAMAYDNLRTLEHGYKRADRLLLIPVLSNIPLLSNRPIALPLTWVVDVMLLLVTAGILLLVEEPPLAVRKLRERFARTHAWLKWLILGFTVLPLGVAIAGGTGLRAVGLGLPLLMAAIAFLDLSPPAKEPPHTLQQFVTRILLALALPILAILVFIVVDRALGLEAALLLVVLPAYFIYKVAVVRDMLFAATAVLFVLAAVVIVLPPINLGPRNVVAYIVFFEMARPLLKHADRVATEYAKLRDKYQLDHTWGWAAPIMPALDWAFAVCRRVPVSQELKTETREETHGKTVGAPA